MSQDATPTANDIRFLFPAIDLREGRVVRLTQGKYDQQTTYGSDPLEQARAPQEAIAALVEQAEALKTGPTDPRFAPAYSSLQIGTLAGGQAINIIPERCCLEQGLLARFPILGLHAH